jgi:hypothetical protein
MVREARQAIRSGKQMWADKRKRDCLVLFQEVRACTCSCLFVFLYLCLWLPLCQPRLHIMRVVEVVAVVAVVMALCADRSCLL